VSHKTECIEINPLPPLTKTLQE